MGQQADIVSKLKSDILRLEHFNSAGSIHSALELGPINEAFPNSVFPLAAVHEFISGNPEEACASSAFITALTTSIIKDNGIALWVSTSKAIYPPALQTLGVRPDCFLFLNAKNDKDILWVLDEALKCSALSVVIGEVRDLSFNESRKLQLAVEQSKVTGFILRHNKKITPTASVSRWKITSLPSEPIDNLPGIGFPKWKVELLRIRNGKPGLWDMQWHKGRFVSVEAKPTPVLRDHQKAG